MLSATEAETIAFQRSPRSVSTPSSSSFCTSASRLEYCEAKREWTEAQRMQPFSLDAAVAASSRSARGRPSLVL
ncbi:hypothetical protein D3C71_1648490 [compost metagenome]